MKESEKQLEKIEAEIKHLGLEDYSTLWDMILDYGYYMQMENPLTQANLDNLD